MISLHQGEETEPMLPTTNATVMVDLADEKSAGSKHEYAVDASQQMDYYPSAVARKNRKLEALKQLVIAIALMMMGASTLRLFQRYSKHHDHHRHRHHFGGAGGYSSLDSGFPAVSSPEKAGWRSGSSSKHAGGRMPRPPFPFMHPPRPAECYALPFSSSDDAVHFNLTVPDFSHSVFMDFSLKDAKLDIESAPIPENDGEETAMMRLFKDKKEGGERGPKHHRKDGPPPPPPCQRIKMTNIMITAKSLSAKEEQDSLSSSSSFKDKNETYICALDLPFGQMGLGLFHGKPSIKEPHHHEGKGVLAAGPPPPPPFEKHHERHQAAFKPVSVKLHFPPGPYTVTSQPPLPPHIGFRPPHPPHHHHHHPKHLKKDTLKKKLLRFLKSFQHKSDEKKQEQDHHHNKSTAKIPAAQDVKAAETILP